MKKHIRLCIAMVGIVFSVETSLAQDTTSALTRKNMLGIRISSKAPAINHSVTYKRFFKDDLAVEGLFSFTDPGALGVLIEKYKPLTASGISWFWGAGAYVGFSGGRKFGTQGVVGLDLLPSTLPLNFSIDWKPELNFTSQFSFEPAAVAFSARFVF